MYVLHRRQVDVGFALALHVHNLAADHAVGSGTGGDLVDHCQACGRVASAGMTRVADQFEGLGQQGIAGQDGDRFAEYLVVGRVSAPEVVIVHGRQVIMDQGIGVDHLHGTGGRDGPLRIPAYRLAGRQHQDGPDPLAACEYGIAHGLVHAVGQFCLFREEGVQCAINTGTLFLEISFQIHRGTFR